MALQQRFTGDFDKAASYHRLGKYALSELKRSMSFQKLAVGSGGTTLEDGTVIFCSVIGSQDIIHINSPVIERPIDVVIPELVLATIEIEEADEEELITPEPSPPSDYIDISISPTIIYGAIIRWYRSGRYRSYFYVSSVITDYIQIGITAGWRSKSYTLSSNVTIINAITDRTHRGYWIGNDYTIDAIETSFFHMSITGSYNLKYVATNSALEELLVLSDSDNSGMADLWSTLPAGPF